MKIKKFNISDIFGRLFTTRPSGMVLTKNSFKQACLYKKELSKEDQEIFESLKNSMTNNETMPFEITTQEENFLQNNPKTEWIDYLIYRYKMKVYPKLRKTSEFPVYLCIEPVSACNLRCIMCFQSDKTFTKKPYMGVMKMELFKNIIDQAVAGGTKAITLASRGEPTMNKNFSKMLEYASGKFYDIKVNTNGTRLTEKMCHDMIKNGVTELVFSIDAEKKELYEKIRLRGVFEKVIDNIKMFNEVRSQYPDAKITTTASGVFFHEEQSIEGFTDFFKKIVDNVAVVRIQNRWNTYTNPVHEDVTSPCEYLWERMYIWFDGKCNPCDVDYKSYLEVGNTSANSIREIWHGEIYTKIRNDHKNKKRGSWNPCDRCGIE